MEIIQTFVNWFSVIVLILLVTGFGFMIRDVARYWRTGEWK